MNTGFVPMNTSSCLGHGKEAGEEIEHLYLWFCSRRSAEVVGTRRGLPVRCECCSFGCYVRTNNLANTFSDLSFKHSNRIPLSQNSFATQRLHIFAS